MQIRLLLCKMQSKWSDRIVIELSEHCTLWGALLIDWTNEYFFDLNVFLVFVSKPQLYKSFVSNQRKTFWEWNIPLNKEKNIKPFCWEKKLYNKNDVIWNCPKCFYSSISFFYFFFFFFSCFTAFFLGLAIIIRNHSIDFVLLFQFNWSCMLFHRLNLTKKNYLVVHHVNAIVVILSKLQMDPVMFTQKSQKCNIMRIQSNVTNKWCRHLTQIQWISGQAFQPIQLA